MAWTAPMTAVVNEIFTSAQFNTHVRDNLLETAVAKATAEGQYFVSTGANTITPRIIDSELMRTSAGENTTSGTYTDLATVGPQVQMTCGTKVLVFMNSYAHNTSSGGIAMFSVEVEDDATSTVEHAADDLWSGYTSGKSGTQGWRGGMVVDFDVTAGSKTFTMKYKSGTAGQTSRFFHSEMIVMSF